MTTASGATFTAPNAWWLTQRDDMIVLEDPDRALQVTLLETSEPDALKAVAASWQRVQPGFALQASRTPESPPPDGDGWEAITTVEYETRSADQRVVVAVARRYGGVTHVALLDADIAALGRRGAQLDTVLETLRPRGMRKESFRGRTPRALDAARMRALDAFIEEARTRLDVPGAAVAVVAGGKVVYEKGFGVRARGKQDPVTPDTVFLIGSITKSMTTMMQATLVDAGLFGWDTPVTQALPGFALGDPELTSKLVMWHTACACTGMPKQNVETLFEYGSVSPEERLASMKTMKPTTRFGETFQYSNLMVAAGGYAAAHAFAPRSSLGAAYDAVMRRKVFEPIGMKSTTLDFGAAVRADHAMPHAAAVDGVTHVLPLAVEHMVIPIRPAGGAWSSARDMARYTITELAKGISPDGRRVVSEANLLARRTPRIAMGDGDHYGLGLVVGTFRDLPVLVHSGGTFGFRTFMFMLPEQGIAIIVLTNTTAAGGDFIEVVQHEVLEALFEGAHDQGRARAKLGFYVAARRDRIAGTLAALTRDPDPRWLSRLAGTYTHASLGTVQVRAGAKGGTFDAGEWQSAIAHKQQADGTVKMVLVDPPLAGGEILVGGDDAQPTLTVQDGQQTYVLERVSRN